MEDATYNLHKYNEPTTHSRTIKQDKTQKIQLN